MARQLPVEEGIICGISSGAAVVAALGERLASLPEFSGKLIAILPDSGERYFSSILYEHLDSS